MTDELVDADLNFEDDDGYILARTPTPPPVLGDVIRAGRGRAWAWCEVVDIDGAWIRLRPTAGPAVMERLFVDFTAVGHARRFTQHLERETRERLRVGQTVAVYGDSVDAELAVVTGIEASTVAFELVGEAACNDFWCFTCNRNNEDALHVYGCECACNLLANDPHPSQ